MSTGAAVFGEFVHCLNKGGLFDIASRRRLKGTASSNNMASDGLAVRAYVGSFEHQSQNKRWSGADKTFIEFMTHKAPRSGLPPGYAEWTEEQLTDGFLGIHITRIVDRNGRLIAPSDYVRR